MKAREYAEALYAAAKGKDEETQERLVLRLQQLLDERGHARLLPRILHELTRVLEERREDSGVLVRVARAGDVDRFAGRIGADIETLGAGALSRTVALDEMVIGGFEVRARGSRIDRTHKRALVELYSTLITS